MHLTQTLAQANQCDPTRISTVFGTRTQTIGDTFDRVARLASGMAGLGVQPGDRVAIYALNSDRYHELLYAVPWMGGMVNLVNVRWSAAEVAYSLVDCDTQIMFVDETFAETAVALRELAPNLRAIVYCGEGDTPDGMYAYETLIAENSPMSDVRRGDDDLYGIFYTGGTTGDPKGVMLSHRACLTSALGTAVSGVMLTRGGNLLHAAPMFHLADLAVWNIGNLTGVTHVIEPSFSVERVIDAIDSTGITDLLLVPTMIQQLVNSPHTNDADLSSLHNVIYGASPIPESVLQRAREVLPNAHFTQAYGMTELAPIATVLSPADHQRPELARSCGRPATHSEILVVGPDSEEVERGTVGEVIVRGDHVMSGYWNKPSETSAALRGGWMHTGDAGYMNESGYLFLVDRIKDMIITGGENVYSVEVENVIVKHPAVAQAAVVGLPDEKWGETVHVVAVLNPGQAVTLEEIQVFARAHIANYKLPRSMEVVDALPISGAGKVLKRDLRGRQSAQA